MIWRSAITHPNSPDPGTTWNDCGPAGRVQELFSRLEGKFFPITGSTLEQDQASPGDWPAFRLLADPLQHPSAVLFPAVSSGRTFSHAEAHAVITAPWLTPLVKIVVTDALPGANGSVRHK